MTDLREAFVPRRTRQPRHKAPSWLQAVAMALRDVTRWRLGDIRFRAGAAAAGSGLAIGTVAVLATVMVIHGTQRPVAGGQVAGGHVAPTAPTASAAAVPRYRPHPPHHEQKSAQPGPSRVSNASRPPATGSQQGSGPAHSAVHSTPGTINWQKIAADNGVPRWALNLASGS